MVRSLLLLALLAFALACPPAPPVTPGQPLGGACRADLDCGDGLVCACGACTDASEEALPPSCDIDLSAACGEPEPCYSVCGDLNSITGDTTCEGGAAECAEGLTEDQCPPGTCWGEPTPGQICDNGVFVCESGAAASGACFTPGACAGNAAPCVFACADAVTFDQACIAEVFSCEVGIEQSTCGNCIGPAPTCVLDCTDAAPVSPALCDNGEFNCAVFGGAVEAETCGCNEAPIDILDATDATALAGTTCSLGPIFILYDDATLTLPDLEIAREVLIFGGNVEEVVLPSLRLGHGTFEVNATPQLRSLAMPALTAIAGNFNVRQAPNLPTCQAQAIAAQATVSGTVNIEGTDDAASCDAGPVPDAGPGNDDAGPEDAGPGADAG